MPYLGNTPTTQNFISGTDYFNGTGAQTAFTLTRTVNSVNDIQVVVNNVVQQPNDAYTLSGTTLTMTSAPSAGTNNVYVRYLSTTTQVITPSQNTVSWNTLDTNTQQDLGLMYKNKIINGNMVIDQRNAGASVSPTASVYTLDRWNAFTNAVGAKYSVQQNAGSVTPPTGFRNYLGITSLSAYTVAAGEIMAVQQIIEGFNIADLGFGTANAKTVTISFWVRSSLTGTFGGALRQGSGARSYPFSYTISAANTWEQKSVTIVGDTSGTYATDNTAGLILSFGLGVGSTFSSTAGSWQSGNFVSATGATSVVGTNGATFYITGVQLEVGTQATAFSTAGGSYGAELALCQRYYQRFTSTVAYGNLAYCKAYNSTTLNCFRTFYVPMRTTPATFESSAANTFFGEFGATAFTGSSIVINGFTTNPFQGGFDLGITGATTGSFMSLTANNNTAAYIAFGAEL